jgi:hypothetical protein
MESEVLNLRELYEDIIGWPMEKVYMLMLERKR